MAVIKRILYHGSRLRPAGFPQLTLFLIIILLATPLQHERRIFWLLVQLMFLDALLVLLSASGMRPRWRWAFLGLWAVGFVANLGGALASRVEAAYWWSVGTQSVAFMVLIGCVFGVLVYIFRSPTVTLDVILAAVTAYLLIALSFAALYGLVLHLDSQSFHLPDWIERRSFAALRTEMVYFSLVTLASLGYGDILPRTPYTQMLAVLEVVIGQFFMTVLVAWLVGMFISYHLTGGR